LTGSTFLKIRILPIEMMVVIIGLSFVGKSQENSQPQLQDHQSDYLTSHLPEKLVSTSDFYNYTRIRDEQFSETLKETWHDYSLFPALSEEPKRFPNNQPVFDKLNLDSSSPSPASLPFSGVVGLNDPGGAPLKMIPRIRKPESDNFNALKGTFLFYGQQIAIRYDKLLTMSPTASVSEDSIAGFWNAFSRSNSNHLVDQLMDYRDILGLGDWGYFQLVKAASACIFPDNRFSGNQITWALMIRSGFDVRLAFNQSTTSVLFPSENILYGRQSVVIGRQRFYLDRPMKGMLLLACPNPFPDNRGVIDLKFYKSLNFHGKLKIQKFGMTWENKKYEFSFRVNPDEVRFLNDYPRTDPVVYFRAPSSTSLKEDLLRQLYPVLSKFNKAVATAFLLKFVQQDFEYLPGGKKDEGLTGPFPEEVIASKSGDDKGKAVLFSWLVRNLLRLPVIGVQFPGCFSTAVGLSDQLDGDGYLLKHSKYILADPTSPNAPAGVLMPELSGLNPLLIELPGQGSLQNSSSEVWKLAYKMGARRGGASQDIIFDRQGRALVTGYFPGKESNNPFVACFSEGNSLQWIRRFEGDGNAAAFAITKMTDDEIYVAGSFSGKLEMDGKTIQTSAEKRGLFLAQFNQIGELIWMKPVPIDSTLQDRPLAYLVKFDRSGNEIHIQWRNEDLRNVKCGFSEVNETGLTFTGYGNFSTFKTRKYRDHGKNGDDSEIIKRSKLLKSKQCNPKVEALLAVLKLLQREGNEVTGNQIQKFINHNNPFFATVYPFMFNLYGRIALLKNENGMISLKTNDYKSLIYNNLKIEDGAKFLISECDNGDVRIDGISGFRNMANPVDLPLNSILIDFSAGNLIIDYDEDHMLKTIWLEPKL